jgi:hypothetical protein
MTDSPTSTTHSLPDEDARSTHNSGALTLSDSFTFEDVLFREHAHANPLDPVTCVVDPRFPFGRGATPETSNSEEPDAKRLKLAASTPVADACTAATDLMCVLAHAPILPDLQHMRVEVEWLLQRIIAVMEALGLESRFLEIFLPTDTTYTALSSHEALDIERTTNPDGLFRRNYYHHNAILHDAECNFLQATAILFREHENWAVAYSLKELLHVRFNKDLVVARLLRGGHLLNVVGLATTDPKTLADRLIEMDADYSIFHYTSDPEEAETPQMAA